MEKEDYTELCSMLLTKTAAISFLSCQVDFKRINITENLEQIRSLQIRGDSEILKLSSLLDASPNLVRLEYQGVSSFDQLSKYSLNEKLASLSRVVLSTYFFSQDSLDLFLSSLPALNYLEMSQIALTDAQMVKCSDKFTSMVVYAHPDIS